MEGKNQIGRWHDISHYEFLKNVAGIEKYPDRALLMDGSFVVVQDGTGLEEYVTYLRRVGLGPDRVEAVPDVTCLADAQWKKIFNGSGCLQVFHTTEKAEALLARLGKTWREAAFSPSAELTENTNCKLTLRAVGTLMGVEEFPPYRVCHSPEAAIAASRRLTNHVGRVLLKEPRAASGFGMRFVRTAAEIRDFWSQFQPTTPIIVEQAFLPHTPMSLQWELWPAGPLVACATAQIIDADGLTHLGNVIAAGNEGLPGVNAADVQVMEEISRPYVAYQWSRGYRGVLGFDFLQAESGRVFLLETNGRVTATSYAMSVARQVADRLNRQWAIAMQILTVSRPKFSGFAELCQAFGQDLFQGQEGIVPFLVRLWPKKIGIMIVKRTVPAALGLLEKTRVQLLD